MNKIQLRNEILNQIHKPEIPPLNYFAYEFGIKPDTGEILTEHIQDAIDRISRQGGGKLILPSGVYYTGALQLKDRVELHLQDKSTIIAFTNEDIEVHYPLVFSHWEATPCYNFSPFIYALDAHDIAVTGCGILDGGADENHWWNWHHQVENSWSADKPDLQLNDRKELRRMNIEGIPIEQRIFGKGHYLRPNFIQTIRCERILLQGFTLHNSPMWQLNPVMCKSLIIDGVNLSSHGSNNDGCDPESCNGVYICNCRFDTGDDCISLKSGRDRDGRRANVPCENVLIENNEFADGHGGVALGSEMSGGIQRVVAANNRFSSPNLTYALRLKTNARRGGKVQDIIMADSVMDHVHGAAVHGTMLYEDGRNGSDLPEFKNITIENITAHGGDYGIFLEAFEEVPITGLVLKNIHIDGAAKPLRSMNWKNPVLENIVINGQHFPRPVKVRILGVPVENGVVKAFSETCGETYGCSYLWLISQDGKVWKEQKSGNLFHIPEQTAFVKVAANDEYGNVEYSQSYTVLSVSDAGCVPDSAKNRLICRNMLKKLDDTPDSAIVTREQLAVMLMPLAGKNPDQLTGMESLQAAIECRFLIIDSQKGLYPEGNITRQEMATIAMQACGVNYRNASSTMPVCTDVKYVGNNYGTNVARALYFGFMELDEKGCFLPLRNITMGEAVSILNRVADFAGL